MNLSLLSYLPFPFYTLLLLLVHPPRTNFYHAHPPLSPPAGIPIKTTLDNPSTVQYAGLIHQLVMKARSTVRDIDPQNDLTFLRVRSKKNEVMIAPGKHFQQVSQSWVVIGVNLF